MSEPASGNEGRLDAGHRGPDSRARTARDREDLVRSMPVRLRRRARRSCRERPVVSRRFGARARTGLRLVASLRFGPAASGEPIAPRSGRSSTTGARPIDRGARSHSRAPDDTSVPVSFQLPLDKLWMGGYELRVDGAVAGEQEAVAQRRLRHGRDGHLAGPQSGGEYRAHSLHRICRRDRHARRSRAGGAAESMGLISGPREGRDFKEEFFSRVRYANEHFCSLGPGLEDRSGDGLHPVRPAGPDRDVSPQRRHAAVRGLVVLQPPPADSSSSTTTASDAMSSTRRAASASRVVSRPVGRAARAARSPRRVRQREPDGFPPDRAGTAGRSAGGCA